MKLSDEVKVAIVAAICILSIAIVFKNVLQLQVSYIISNGPLYLFVVYLITRSKTERSKCDRPLYWGSAIVMVTVLTILVYVV